MNMQPSTQVCENVNYNNRFIYTPTYPISIIPCFPAFCSTYYTYSIPLSSFLMFFFIYLMQCLGIRRKALNLCILMNHTHSFAISSMLPDQGILNPVRSTTHILLPIVLLHYKLWFIFAVITHSSSISCHYFHFRAPFKICYFENMLWQSLLSYFVHNYNKQH